MTVVCLLVAIFTVLQILAKARVPLLWDTLSLLVWYVPSLYQKVFGISETVVREVVTDD